MAIEKKDLRILKSQNLYDNDEGGGAMTGQEVKDGVSNNLFPDISGLDKTYGRISMRKAFVAVLTKTTDVYYGAHVIVSKMPADPKVSVTLFSTKNWFDRRRAVQDRLERYLARGPIWAGHLLEKQLEGQRAIQIVTRVTDEEPRVSQGLVLVQNEGKANEFEQYVRVTKIVSKERTFVVNKVDVVRKVVTIDISDPLRYNFDGCSVEEFENGIKPLAICRDTRIADAATYFGIAKVAVDGRMNDMNITVDSIFTQLIPSATSETPMVDISPSGLSSVYVKGNEGDISTSMNVTLGANINLYIGGAIMPTTFSLEQNGRTITDDGGILRNGEIDVGTIEYDKGLLNFNSRIGSNYTGNAIIKFQPAVVPMRIANTAALTIVQDARGYNYVITLRPYPSAKSLVVSYQSQGKSYNLYDMGNGILKGSDSAFGTGSIDYTTGSVILTTGALPDADSTIIFSWGTTPQMRPRADLPVDPAFIMMQTAKKNIAPASVKITWKQGKETKTATDNGRGELQGDALGSVHYASGVIKLIPKLLPMVGVQYEVTYDWGEPLEQEFRMPSRNAEGLIMIKLPPNVREDTLEITWNTLIHYADELGDIFYNDTVIAQYTIPKDPLVTAYWKQDINKFKRFDKEDMKGTFDAVSGNVEFNPDYEVQIPKPKWSYDVIGTNTYGVWEGRTHKTIVRETRKRTMTVDYVRTIATMPYDESGYVIARFRLIGGDTTEVEVFQGTTMNFDLTTGFNQGIVVGSVRFTLGGKTYVDRDTTLIHSIDPRTNVGVTSGQIEYVSGKVQVSEWTEGGNNLLVLESLTTETTFSTVDEVVFRTPIAPVRVGSLQMRAVFIGDAKGERSITFDAQGRINENGFIGGVDYQTGVVSVKFAQEMRLTDEVKKEPWFEPDDTYTRGGVEYTMKPMPVIPDTIKYNSVGYTYLPLSSEILGIDPVRLPSDGRVPIFNVGGVVVTHNTQKTPFSSDPKVGEVVNVGRERLSSVRVIDSADKELPEDMYFSDLNAGTVTLSSKLNLSTFNTPLYVEHKVEDMAVVTDVQINGLLSLSAPLTHSYPKDSSYVSSALLIQDMTALVTNKFEQDSWKQEWKDEPTGSTILPKYNDILNPIELTNQGSYTDRWAIIFTSATSFRVISENQGEIMTGTTSQDVMPLNVATNSPYFILRAAGWGTGWASGNVLRFNTTGANFPIWTVRTILQGDNIQDNDGFQLNVRGDIDK